MTNWFEEQQRMRSVPHEFYPFAATMPDVCRDCRGHPGDRQHQVKTCPRCSGSGVVLK